MSDDTNFGFARLVPGFDFLQNLAKGASQSLPQMSKLSSWVAPTLNVEELEKRITELKAVQFWLDQNGKALAATIQALEVQKMTLSTLRGMNLRMEDLANAFARSAAPPPAAAAPAPSAPAPAPQPQAEPLAEAEAEPEDAAEAPPPKRKPKGKAAAASSPAAPAGAGVVDPLQWWGALTQQFQQIASSALQDASQLKMPAMAQPLADAVGQAMDAAAGQPARKAGPAARKAPAKGAAAAKKTAARKRTRTR
jgi:ribosomal protein L12E/L44/L45/RPP1/RPP2